MLLQKDDVLNMLSAGYVDEIGGADRETLGAKRLKELLNNISRLAMYEQKLVPERTIE
jgi:hypothetical protein